MLLIHTRWRGSAAFTSRPCLLRFPCRVVTRPSHPSPCPNTQQRLLYRHFAKISQPYARQGTTLKVTMSQVASLEQSSQSIAEATLAFLSSGQHIFHEASLENQLLQPEQSHTSHQEPHENATPLTVVPSTEVTTPAPIQADAPARDHGARYTAVKPLLATTSHALPSLLRYVDVELMRSAAYHDQPTHSGATCCICFYQWNTPLTATRNGLTSQPAITSTFLPLSPCRHWVHYRCLIWLASKNDVYNRDKCPHCHTTLFKWEGITALTLTTRTGIDMEDSNKGGSIVSGSFSSSDKAQYESDCAVIESIIHAQFFAHLSKLSKCGDRSPDLVQCLYDVIDTLKRMEKPQAAWLRYETKTGYLLWGMLVTIKMRRYLVEGHAAIQGTEGWRAFEEGRRTLQGRIMEEVRGG
jgi:hypothetical protein